jgi:hypothetical protein
VGYGLRQDLRARHAFVDALEYLGIRVRGDEHDLGAAHLAQPSGRLDAFAAAFQDTSISTISGVSLLASQRAARSGVGASPET